MKIQRDYQKLPKLIKKMQRLNYNLLEAYGDFSALDFRQDCVDVGVYLKKHILSNRDLEEIAYMK